MSRNAFTHPEMLIKAALPIPTLAETAAALPAFDLSTAMPINKQIEGYRMLYGFDQLDANHWQGRLDVANYQLHLQFFQPKDATVKGVVWLLHGYLEHSGIYLPIIDELLAENFSVLTFDLPGHGLSSGDEASIQDFEEYQTIIHELSNRFLSHPFFSQQWLGIGQSTGGAIWIDHFLQSAQARKQPIVNRALLLSPLVHPSKTSWWHNSFGLGIVRKIRQQIPRKFRRNNHNPEFLRFVRLADPLQARSMHVDWILALTKWMERIEKYPACRIPVWVAQGALDQTVDWQYNIKFIREKFRLQTLLILEEGSHQLINERQDIRSALTGLIPAFLHSYSHRHYY